MLLRICLIIALVGGLAAGVVNFVMVKDHLTTVIADRDQQKSDKEKAQADAAKTHKELAATKAQLDTTTRELTKTKGELASAQGEITQKDAQIADLTSHLTDEKTARTKDEQELAQWSELKLSPQQVVATVDELKRTKAERDGVVAENKLLNKDLQSVKTQLAQLVNPDEVPALPTGLKGKVVAVDPKYKFVVLNIGDDKGVLVRGEMMVAREGRLIGKVRIARVDKNESVANLIPGWTRGEVEEGDEVIY